MPSSYVILCATMLVAYIRTYRWVSIVLMIAAWTGYSLWVTNTTGSLVTNRFAELIQQPKLVAATLIVDRDWSTLARLYAETYQVNSGDLTSPYVVRLAQRNRIEQLLALQPDSRELNYQLLLIAQQMQDRPAIDALSRKLKTLDPTFTP